MPLTWNLKQWLRTNRGLKNAKEIRVIIYHRTRHNISLKTVQNFLKNKPKTLHAKTLQAICDAFRCKLNDFCRVTPSSSPPTHLVNDLHLQPLLEPCTIASHETLFSFIARLQLAAIQEAASISDNYAQAAHRLGYTRTSLHDLRTRLNNTTTLNQNARGKRTSSRSSKAIPLPTAIFTIRKNEDLQAFISRIQLAAIIQTRKIEGNHTRAALRLGYTRSSLHQLFSRLQGSRQRLI